MSNKKQYLRCITLWVGSRLYYDTTLMGSVVLNPTVNSGKFITFNAFASDAALRITFDCKKSMKLRGNKSHVTVYNLAKETLKGLNDIYKNFSKDGKNGLLLRLSAGYSYVDNEEVILFGDVTSMQYADTRPGNAVTFEVTEGNYIKNTLVLNKSYPEGTPLSTIAKDCKQLLKDSGVVVSDTVVKGFGVLAHQAKKANLLNTKTANGYTSDRVVDTLVSIYKGLGYRVYFNNGVLVIAPANATAQNEVPVLSETSGLLGVPFFYDGNKVEFNSLLIPSLRLGSMVVLKPSKSLYFNGWQENSAVIVNSIQIQGDNYEGSFTCNCKSLVI